MKLVLVATLALVSCATDPGSREIQREFGSDAAGAAIGLKRPATVLSRVDRMHGQEKSDWKRAWWAKPCLASMPACALAYIAAHVAAPIAHLVSAEMADLVETH